MQLLAYANKKANEFLGLDYLTIGLKTNSNSAFVCFTLLYVLHIIFVVFALFLIINMFSIFKIIGAILLWIVITYVFKKIANKFLGN